MGKKHDKGLENFLLLHGNFAPKSYNRRKKHEQQEYIKLFRCVQKRSQQNYQPITRASHKEPITLAHPNNERRAIDYVPRLLIKAKQVGITSQ